MNNQKEVMNAGMEKDFFTWIMDHPTQFYKVEPSFFKNEDIQFIYKIIRDEYIINKSKKVPSPQQIVAMIKLHDPEENISNQVIKTILKNDNSDIDTSWLENRFKAWRLSKQLTSITYDSIDQIRNLNEIDYNNVSDIAAKIKSIYNNLSLIENDDEDLGVDFDDPESHKQEISLNKIPSGWGNVDLLLSGGWDKGTFSVLMGETNVGKCTLGQTRISVKNKNTNEIKDIKIEDFYELLKK